MPVTYDITKDSFYTEGMQKGIEKGLQEGIEKGIEQGIQKEREKNEQQQINTIRELLTLGLNATQIKKAMSLSDERYVRLIKQF